MQINEVKINEIKPDPNQPRKSIDEIDLREMAQSIVTEGVINPIEIDKNNVIITGERRWRAAKIAGLKTVPAKILELTGEERFMRQVIENIHHNTMSDWDTANALQHLIDVNFQPRKVKGNPETGISWLAEKTGKSLGYIEGKLDHLRQSDKWKEAIKTGKVEGKFTAVLAQTVKDFRPIMEEKILNNEFKTRNEARELASALSRERDNPRVVKKLLDTDYSKFTKLGEVEKVIQEISPRVSELITKSYEPSQKISKIAEDLKEWVRSNPKGSVGLIHAPRIVVNLNFMKTLIDEWFKGNEDEPKLLEK
jgi:ParB family chromosome partitioning protein